MGSVCCCCPQSAVWWSSLLRLLCWRLPLPALVLFPPQSRSSIRIPLAWPYPTLPPLAGCAEAWCVCMDGLCTTEFVKVSQWKQLSYASHPLVNLYVFSLTWNHCSHYLWCIVYQANKLFHFISFQENEGQKCVGAQEEARIPRIEDSILLLVTPLYRNGKQWF
jgi:hypothetical protein